MREPSESANSAGVSAPSSTRASKTSSSCPGAEASEYERDTNSPVGKWSPRFMNWPGRNGARSASRSVMRPGAQSLRSVTVVSTRAKGLLKPSVLQLGSENLGGPEKPDRAALTLAAPGPRAQKSDFECAETVYAYCRMSFPITCTACQKTFTISDEIYKKKVTGRVVTIKCKSCGQGIRVDGTKGASAQPSTPPVAAPSELAAAPSEP